MVRFWLQWASQMAVALHTGNPHMVQMLVRIALAITLAALGSVGIYYGPRLAG